jgi:hypothetical protein
MNDPHVIDFFFYPCNLNKTAKLSYYLFQVEALIALIRLRHDQSDANKVCVCTFEISNDLVSLYFGFMSLECSREQSELLNVFNVVE